MVVNFEGNCKITAINLMYPKRDISHSHKMGPTSTIRLYLASLGGYIPPLISP